VKSIEAGSSGGYPRNVVTFINRRFMPTLDIRNRSVGRVGGLRAPVRGQLGRKFGRFFYRRLRPSIGCPYSTMQSTDRAFLVIEPQGGRGTSTLSRPSKLSSR